MLLRGKIKTSKNEEILRREIELNISIYIYKHLRNKFLLQNFILFYLLSFSGEGVFQFLQLCCIFIRNQTLLFKEEESLKMNALSNVIYNVTLNT